MNTEEGTRFLNKYINENYDEIRSWVKYNEQVRRVQQRLDEKVELNELVMKYEDWQALERKCWG